MIDVSSIAPTQTGICLYIEFEGDGNTTPVLENRNISYFSTYLPYLQFDVGVKLWGITQSLIHNSASILTSTPEIRTDNNQAFKNMNIITSDVWVTKTRDKASVLSGDYITYTIEYGNNGPQEAEEVVIIDLLWTGIDFESSSPLFIASGASYIRTIWTLPVNSGGTIILTGKVTTATPHQIVSNTVEIQTKTHESYITNNKATATSIIGTYANVYTTIACSPKPWHINHQVDCIVSYGNNGNAIATGIVLTWIFDAITWYAITQVNNSDCAIQANQVVCSGGIFAEFTSGFVWSFLVTGTVANDINLLVNHAILRMESRISTMSSETNIMDNYDDDYVPIAQKWASLIQGKLYVDSNNIQYNTGIDILMAGAEIFRWGKDIYGNYYLPSQTTYPDAFAVLSWLINESFTTYRVANALVTQGNGEYFITPVDPGTYYIYSKWIPSYANKYSTAGSIEWEKSGTGSIEDPNITWDLIVGIVMGDAQQSFWNDFAIQGECGNDTVEIGEQCDGQIWCSSVCEREQVSCSIETGLAYSWMTTTITWIVNTWWVVVSGINFWLPDYRYSIGLSWDYITGHSYYSWWSYQVSMEVAHPNNENITWSCSADIQVHYCGDGVINWAEQCDLWAENWPDSACSSSCTWNVPSCTLTVSPLTWDVPLTWTFTISQVNTWWMNFDRLEFGDGNTGAVDTWTLVYENLYTTTGTYTWILQVSNRHSWSLIAQCQALIETSLCEDIIRSPSPTTVCTPQTFTQTSNCGTTRIATGTKHCGGGGWSTIIKKDNCCRDPQSSHNLPWANEACGDDSPSYYDDTCLWLDYHGSADNGLFCTIYTDEAYLDNGPFTDTKTHRWFQYIEVMRKSCLHRGKETKQNLWRYHPDDYVKKSEILKTLVKIAGVAFGDFTITTEDKRYPYELVYQDLTPTHWFSWYSEYAYTRGLTNGLEYMQGNQRRIKPNEYVSRNDIVKKIVELHELINGGEVEVSGKTKITDVRVSDPYYTYIRKAEEIWCISWFPQKNGTYLFKWHEYVTRAQFAKMVSIPFNALLFE